MSRLISVGLTPCPNDTFTWGGIALGHIRSPLRLSFRYEDIQQLNELAARGEVDVVKISFFQYAFLPRGVYRLLPAGAALGYGVGPLLIAPKPLSHKELLNIPIGVPGRGTTAYSLLHFYLPEVKNVIEIRYDKLLTHLAKRDIGAAVIIHESRFTYREKGFICLQDLGAYWTAQTSYPIPLGGIAVKRHVPKTLLARLLRRSLKAAWKRKIPNLQPYISNFAQEMEPSVQEAHIQLYVNHFTYRLGSTGWEAVRYYLRWVRAHFQNTLERQAL
ncbi:MAG: MqnA/MqnD/SBP family protein [Bacteroidia bacterium]|nr:1,4-dihydroxy-6-naphthoate synthase [Bacteroidia bacterium]MDW8133704.1 MqnA/MqnD/SBP family protein [Bacteroidia bacterium]